MLIMLVCVCYIGEYVCYVGNHTKLLFRVLFFVDKVA